MASILDLLPSTETMMRPDKYLAKFAEGVAKGVSTDLVGAPVDIINMGLKAVGVPVSKKPVGGSDWIREQFGIAPVSADSGADTAGNLASAAVNPAKASLMMAKISQILPALAGAGGMIVDASKVKSPETIARFYDMKGGNVTKYLETGVFEGKIDGKLRAEISDTKAKLNTDLFDHVNKGKSNDFFDFVAGKEYKLSEVLQHDELYKIHPELKEVRIGNRDTLYGDGYYSSASNYIGIGAQRSVDEIMNVVLHETQHAIQANSGFAQGGSPAMFHPEGFSKRSTEVKDRFNKIYKEVRTVHPNQNPMVLDKVFNDPTNKGWVNTSNEFNPNLMKEFRAAKADYDDVIKIEQESFDKYLHIAGEAEARVVPLRRHAEMNYSARNANVHPFSDYEAVDANIGKLIQSPLDSMVSAVIDPRIPF